MSDVAQVLTAGRELDALIAEKVMGWHRLPYDPPVPGLRFRPEWFDVDGETTGYFWEGGGGDYYHPDEEWSPSTDIAAAWTVVEKLSGFVSEREHPWWSVAVFYAQPEHVVCVIYACPPGALINDASDEIATAISSTAPKAICLAALKACGALQ